jgi:hypothetical protein
VELTSRFCNGKCLLVAKVGGEVLLLQRFDKAASHCVTICPPARANLFEFCSRWQRKLCDFLCKYVLVTYGSIPEILTIHRFDPFEMSLWQKCPPKYSRSINSNSRFLMLVTRYSIRCSLHLGKNWTPFEYTSLCFHNLRILLDPATQKRFGWALGGKQTARERYSIPARICCSPSKCTSPRAVGYQN